MERNLNFNEWSSFNCNICGKMLNCKESRKLIEYSYHNDHILKDYIECCKFTDMK